MKVIIDLNVYFELQLSMKYNDEILLNHHVKTLEKVGRAKNPRSFAGFFFTVAYRFYQTEHVCIEIKIRLLGAG